MAKQTEGSLLSLLFVEIPVAGWSLMNYAEAAQPSDPALVDSLAPLIKRLGVAAVTKERVFGLDGAETLLVADAIRHVISSDLHHRCQAFTEDEADTFTAFAENILANIEGLPTVVPN